MVLFVVVLCNNYNRSANLVFRHGKTKHEEKSIWQHVWLGFWQLDSISKTYLCLAYFYTIIIYAYCMTYCWHPITISCMKKGIILLINKSRNLIIFLHYRFTMHIKAHLTTYLDASKNLADWADSSTLQQYFCCCYCFAMSWACRLTWNRSSLLVLKSWATKFNQSD